MKKIYIMSIAVLFIIFVFTYGVYSGNNETETAQLVANLYTGEFLNIFSDYDRLSLTKPMWQTNNDNKSRSSKGLGYIGTTDIDNANALKGVVEHDTKASYQGYNLLVSGHNSNALLIDNSGNVKHEWSFADTSAAVRNIPQNHWRNAHLFPNGDLLVIYSRAGMFRIDKKSNILWSTDKLAHHEAIVKNDKIYLLTAKGEKYDNINKEHKLYANDYITVMSLDGKVLEEHSILDAVRQSKYYGLESLIPAYDHDMFHVNAIEYITSEDDSNINHPAFKKGNLLLSARNIHTLMVYNPRKRTIVWARNGRWSGQHDPVITSNGQILFFDNGRVMPIDNRQKSRVVKYDPEIDAITWQYSGEGLDNFYSKRIGAVQELPNGNILVSESQNARAFEITPQKEIVWMYHNPFAPKDSDKVGVIFNTERFSPEYLNFIQN